MQSLVDIQMPARKNTFIVGDVFERYLMQDAAFTFHVDTTDDFIFSDAHEEMVKLMSTSPEGVYRIQTSIEAAFKRNKMRNCGDSPYIYLADPDVLLPERPVFKGMIDALERHPQLGAVGVCYQENDHVGCGAMMLRRGDLERIGELKGGQKCLCNFISRKLRDFGLFTVPFRTVRATHLKEGYRQGYSGYDVVRHQSSDGVLEQGFLEDLIEQYGTHFKLFTDMPNPSSVLTN